MQKSKNKVAKSFTLSPKTLELLKDRAGKDERSESKIVDMILARELLAMNWKEKH